MKHHDGTSSFFAHTNSGGAIPRLLNVSRSIMAKYYWDYCQKISSKTLYVVKLLINQEEFERQLLSISRDNIQLYKSKVVINVMVSATKVSAVRT